MIEVFTFPFILISAQINDQQRRGIYFQMGQGIQEWTNQNLWKTAFKYFTWHILEYLDTDFDNFIGYFVEEHSSMLLA